MAGLDPGHPAQEGTAVPHVRDRRVKPGDDGGGELAPQGRTSVRPLQRHLPNLADEIDAEIPMRLLGDLGKAAALIDRPRRDQDALRPQRDPAVAGTPSETNTFLDEPASDAVAAGARLDQEEAELRDAAAGVDQHDRADRLAVDLCDPAGLALGVEAGEEFGDD